MFKLSKDVKQLYQGWQLCHLLICFSKFGVFFLKEDKSKFMLFNLHLHSKQYSVYDD